MMASNIEHQSLTDGIRVVDDRLFFERKVVRQFLPHRGRMLLVDGVRSLSYMSREIESYKLVGQNDPGLEGQDKLNARLPPTLLIEALAQTCGFLMNVLHFCFVNDIPPAEITDARHAQRPLKAPSLSVLCDSRFKHMRSAVAGELVVLTARVLTIRNDLWYFQTSAHAGDELSSGEIMLAYPSYTKEFSVALGEKGRSLAGAPGSR
jgi:3-hydroxymyristoyl/3-hydroxydecanoyl-(acyl carrier protein) dehydratase